MIVLIEARCSAMVVKGKRDIGVNDGERADELAKGIVGKRLTYRRPNRKDVQA
jgi:hypothetical protein